MVTTVTPGTARPCKKRSTVRPCTDSTWIIAIVGSANAHTEATTIALRPSASEAMPISGDTSATASTVAPTALPICTTVAFRSRCSSGKIDCTEYTCKNANTPTSAIVNSSSGPGRSFQSGRATGFGDADMGATQTAGTAAASTQ